MKPLKLVMSAFGPYAARQEIDFNTLSGEDIFLVTGDTGAGKTTIFDAMSFALFGGASGDSRKPSTFKSDHAKPEDICCVELEFVLRGRKYFIRRTPAQRGVKRDGGTKEIAPSAELCLPDGETVTGTNAVTERIEQILGLNHRQFKQTTMLAQGGFKQMIEASGREKQQIFSKIFGTSIYSDFTELLAREEADLARITQSARNSITRCVRELGGCGHPLLQTETAAFMPYPQILSAAADGLLSFEAESGRLDADISHTEAQLQKLDPEGAKAINEKLDRRDRLRAQITGMRNKEPEYAELESRLARLTAAAELDEQEKIILSAKKQSESLAAEISALESQLDILREKERELEQNEATGSAETLDLTARLNAKTGEYERLYRDFLSSRAAFLAKSLNDGEPCPVCGSAHHPAPAKSGADMPSEKALNDAKNSISTLQKKLDALRETEKETRRQAKSDCEKCAARLEAAVGHKESVDSEFQKQRAGFMKKLEASGFDGYKDYRRALENRTCVDLLKRQSEEYRERLISAAAQLQELERDTENREREDIVALMEKRGGLAAALKGMREKKSQLYLNIQGTKNRLKELESLHKESSDAERRHVIARELAGLAKGSRTVSFERYVLASYFDDIVKFSNIHLQRMTSSRYRLRRLETSENGMVSGLDLEIIDSYTGKPRDVSTLSGGESFKASLALALGLSGVVQMYAGGVSIDTMFIDEGFGSLDEKSLDSAVETLFSLKKSGRMVGIISHVPQLREYIPKKLAVRFTPLGSRAEWN